MTSREIPALRTPPAPDAGPAVRVPPAVPAPQASVPTLPAPQASAPTLPASQASAPTVEVRRSARRRRTVSAYRDGDRVVVLLPARLSRADEQRWIRVMLERLAAQERRRGGRVLRGDAELGQRAAELSRRFFDGAAKPASVRWVANQAARWGSCTPADGTIRLSDRLREMPGWVVDYVLVHELAHLIEIGHGPRFQALVDRYPRAERARGYLLGVTAVSGTPVDPDPDADLDADTGPDLDPDADLDADLDANPDAETGTDTGADTGSRPAHAERVPRDRTPPVRVPESVRRRATAANGSLPGLW